MKYKESNNSDDYETQIDADTGDVIKEKKREGKDKIAHRLQRKFIEMAEKEVGIKPVLRESGYYVVLRAMKDITEDEILQLFEDWFDESMPDKHMIQITRALSATHINEWNVENK